MDACDTPWAMLARAERLAHALAARAVDTAAAEASHRIVEAAVYAMRGPACGNLQTVYVGWPDPPEDPHAIAQTAREFLSRASHDIIASIQGPTGVEPTFGPRVLVAQGCEGVARIAVDRLEQLVVHASSIAPVSIPGECAP